MNKKTIAIVAGGDSSEYSISLASANGIYAAVDKNRYTPYIVVLKKGDWHVQLADGTTAPIDRNDFGFDSAGTHTCFDFAYITIHGTPGENGRLQGYFDMIGLPYSACGVLASALTFNKFTCNNYLRSRGINVADSIRLLPGTKIDNAEIINQLGLPVFIKPNDGGSSCGTSKVKHPDEIQPAIRKAFDEGEEVIIEQFIPGTEVTCGCIKLPEKSILLPVTEVVSKNEFFDFEAKYTASKVEEITPARISKELTEEIQRITSYIYDSIGAKGIIRVDYIIAGDGKIRMLEVNTTPGMTATSFIPQQIKAAGLDLQTILTEIIESELNNNTYK